jgi:hypothetical protein
MELRFANGRVPTYETFFTAGTAEEVTGIAQGGVDCADRALQTALQTALDAKPELAQGDA